MTDEETGHRGIMQRSSRPGGIMYLNQDEVDGAVEIINGPKQDKIQFIYDLKACFRWVDGKTHKDLAKCWDCGQGTVRALAVNADNHFRMNLGDPDAIHGALMAKIEFIATSAMNNKKAVVVQTSRETSEIEMVDAPDHKAALAGLVAIGNLTGLNRRKIDVKVDVNNLTFEEMVKKMREENSKQNKELAEEPQPLLTEGKEIDV